MKKTVSLIVILLLASVSIEVLAQGCPMCKTAIEEARKNGSHVGDTLNSGIMYLLALPYIVVSVFGVIWYKNHKASKKISQQL